MSIDIDRILTGGLEVATDIIGNEPKQVVNTPNVVNMNEVMTDVDFISDTDTSLDSFDNKALASDVSEIRDQLFKAKELISTTNNMNKLTLDCVDENIIKNNILRAKETEGVNDRSLFKKLPETDCGVKSIVDSLTVQQDILSLISDSMLDDINKLLEGTIGEINVNGCLTLDKAKTVNRALNKYAKAVGSITGDMNLKTAALANKENCGSNGVSCTPTITLDLNPNMIPIPDGVIEGIQTVSNYYDKGVKTLNDKLNEVIEFKDSVENMAEEALGKVAGKVFDTIGPRGVELGSEIINAVSNINNYTSSTSVNSLKNLAMSSVADIAFCLGNDGVSNFVGNLLTTGIARPSEIVSSITHGITENIDKNIFNKFLTIKSVIEGINDDAERLAAIANVKHLLPTIIDSIGKNKMITDSPAKMYNDVISGIKLIDPNWDENDMSLLAKNPVMKSVVDTTLTSGINRELNKTELLKHRVVSNSKNKYKNNTNPNVGLVEEILDLPVIYDRGNTIVYDPLVTTNKPNTTFNKNVLLPNSKPTESDIVNTISSTIGDNLRF